MIIAVSDIEFNETPDIDEAQLMELQESIKEKGLSHPIIVRRENSSERFKLVSGEKRLRSIIRLGLTSIEATVRELTEDEGKEIRLHENLKRFNLPWWDQVILVEELHQLRQKVHGLPKEGRPVKSEGKTGWSIRDTARELSVGIGPLSEDLSLARAIRGNPALKNIKDKKTAIRIIRTAATRHTAELEATLPSNIEGDQVFFGDSASVLSMLPASSIHHAITDPPWINFFDPALRIDERTLPVFRELYRVLKHGAFLFLFCGLDDYSYYAGVDEPHAESGAEPIHQSGQLEKIGFKVAKTPLLWQKVNSLSRRGVASWEYDRDFEFIVVAVKGAPALTTGRQLSSIKKHAIVHPSKMIHPNEKPVELIKDLIEDCSYQGQVIIDPFAGSGVLGQACKDMKRKYMLIEREKQNYDNICGRLK